MVGTGAAVRFSPSQGSSVYILDTDGQICNSSSNVTKELACGRGFFLTLMSGCSLFVLDSECHSSEYLSRYVWEKEKHRNSLTSILAGGGGRM